jgi:hypothetical protein
MTPAKLEHHAAVEIEPKNTTVRFTLSCLITLVLHKDASIFEANSQRLRAILDRLERLVEVFFSRGEHESWK